MEQLLTEMAGNNGIWATLFITLFLYQLKENKTARVESQNLLEQAHERENKLVSFLNEMSRNFEKLTSQYERLADDVDFIKVEIAKEQVKNEKK